jgi:putative Mg2+ transporter-C (MgtC) family protein
LRQIAFDAVENGCMERIEHLSEALRVMPHAAALAFAYVLALPIGWDRE